MSHTIGQAKEDNQQSNSNSSQAHQDSPQLESTPLKSAPPLSDADYEFLFNQLLEGIAHGWHDQRIIKFFKQLGDRGLQADWVAWLNRVCPKLLKLPPPSRRQLGTMMIRFGELTQAATEVNQIGFASHNVGRELLFGNSQSVVWEYDGPDLVVDLEPISLETEQELSARLPLDFAALGSEKADDTKSDSASVAQPEQSSAAGLLQDVEADNLKPQPEVESLPDSAEQEVLAEAASAPVEDTAPVPSPADSSLGKANGYGEEFEFEREEFSPSFTSVSAATSEIASGVSANEQADSLGSASTKSGVESNQGEAIDTQNGQINQALTLELQETSPVAIDMQQVMDLIQEDEELAQQISAKLNLPENQASASEVIPQSSTNISEELDDTHMELVEGWFNLGLKHVSAGEFDKAIASWEKALKINPNLSEAWHNRGSALGRLGSYEAAVESFQSALAIDPHNYQAWNDRAHALYQLQNWAEAVNSWSNALQIMPGNHLFWYNRGCALEQLEQWQDAIASYEKALEIKPDFQPGRSRYINLVADNSRSN